VTNHPNRNKKATIASAYIPVRFDKTGLLAVQISVPDTKELLGWADELGKFDRTGSWEICDSWSTEQEKEFSDCVDKAREYSQIEITYPDSVTRVVTSTI
jgi:hypothetical protein